MFFKDASRMQETVAKFQPTSNNPRRKGRLCEQKFGDVFNASHAQSSRIHHHTSQALGVHPSRSRGQEVFGACAKRVRGTIYGELTYTRAKTRAQIATSPQASCYKSVHTFSTSCARTACSVLICCNELRTRCRQLVTSLMAL